LSPDFDEVPLGTIAPEYGVRISEDGTRIEFVHADITDSPNFTPLAQR